MNRVLVWGFSNNLAGTEAVVSNYVMKCSDTAFDIFSYEETPNYDALFESGKNKLIVLPRKSAHLYEYWTSIRRCFEENSNLYSALWCNYNSYSNIDALMLAKQHGIQKRIIHAHNSMPVGGWRTRFLSRINKKRAIAMATELWACSAVAGSFFFDNASYDVLPNAIDYESCRFSLPMRTLWREKLGVGDETIVIGSLGRLSAQKNYVWLVELANDLRALSIDFRVVIAGDGEDRSVITEMISSYGLTNDVTLLGSISEAKSLLSAFDVFVLPSLYEGLPLSLLEAQANGLPCLVSDTVSREAAITNTCRFISLDNRKEWLKAVTTANRTRFDPMTPEASRYSLDYQAAQIAMRFN